MVRMAKRVNIVQRHKKKVTVQTNIFIGISYKNFNTGRTTSANTRTNTRRAAKNDWRKKYNVYKEK